MNNQKPEARVQSDGELLDFHSMFFTIQGEGPFVGHRAVFIRLAGCNLQCPGCDTEYTEGRELWYARRIAEEASELAAISAAPHCLIVITGGEPFRQNIGVLVTDLVRRGHRVQIESNGVFAPDETTIKWIGTRNVSLVISPKTRRVNDLAARHAVAFKYVLDHTSVGRDGLPIKALGHPAPEDVGVARPPPGIPVYLNPFDSGDARLNILNLKAAARSAKRYGYILGVQIHKLAGLE